MLPFVEQASANDAAGGEYHAQGHQDISPVELGGLGLIGRDFRDDRFQRRPLKDGNIAGLVQGDPVDGAAVVGGDRYIVT